MALTTKTNANIDALAGAVPAPYGPLTRVTDMDALGYIPNSDRPIAFTSNVSTTAVSMSYDQLADVRTRDEILKEAHSKRNINGEFDEMVKAIAVLYAYTSSMSLPHLDSEKVLVLEGLRAQREIVAQPPNFINMNANPPVTLIVDFTVVDAEGAGAGLAAQVTNTTVGGFLYRWDWGDGTFSTGQNPANHTYGGAGVKTVTLTVIGWEGVKSVSKNVTMA